MMKTYDAIIVGAGQAGPPLAERLIAAGQTVCLVERGRFGGTCVNTGCMPTKTLVASAHAAHIARRAGDFGVIAGPVSIDFARVMARKDKVVDTASGGVRGWLDGMKGCTVLEGHARFVSPTEMQVGESRITAPTIFLNVGGRAVIPDLPGVHDVPVLTNTTILQLTELPEHLVVVGGSYIGLEFAQMFRRFGSEVTVVEKGERIIQREDVDISEAIQAALEAEGVRFRLKADCITFVMRGDRIAVGVDCNDSEPEVLGTHVLLAVGRRPNTDDLDLDKAGVVVDARGAITVDDQLQTTVDGIWALGDCNGRGAFTHTAYNDFEIVADNLLAGADRKVTDRIDTYALYVDPPLGRVGMTEAQALAAGHRIEVGVRPMTRVGRAVEKGETRGLMKIVIDADTQAILGGAILGPGGDEAIHAVVNAMASGARASTLQHTVHIHPTVSELIPTIVGERKPVS
ncbi:MAG: mercuric reductase [Brevundimonas subvibrioides]|uniref:Mercuric reductase n=1 Tax=Brevundimonas subvibrioides TaxID=74313 RepID=A0A258HNI9_9CAUL|nr:MAG: mercuric reductase [Brevundimonas subvibrioides]